MSLFSEKLHKTNEYHAGEILIGSFCAIRHDVVKQCETIRHLHELGEVVQSCTTLGLSYRKLQRK